MNKKEIQDIIKNGENSSVEFKRDDLTADAMSKEIVAMSNLSGGKILLGVDDDQTISGLQRSDTEEWVMNIARQNIFPPVIPHYAKFKDFIIGKDIAVITIPPSPSKPCRSIIKNRKIPFIRVGSTVREASDDELMQMLQANQRLNFGKIGIPEAKMNTLYTKRIRQYLEDKLKLAPDITEEEFYHILQNLELSALSGEKTVPTINSMLLFGKTPKKYLFQSGVRSIVYTGKVESYEIIEDAILDDPLIPDLDDNGRVNEYGLIERVIHFIGKHCPPRGGSLDHVRNNKTSEFPNDLLRELIVNSLVHRDYTISGADILLSIFSDRLEIKTPGRLPNGATIEGLKKGFRYYRNQTLVNIMRDYGYIDARGMGIRLKIIPQTIELTGQEPQFIATDYDFTVIIPRPQNKNDQTLNK